MLRHSVCSFNDFEECAGFEARVPERAVAEFGEKVKEVGFTDLHRTHEYLVLDLLPELTFKRLNYPDIKWLSEICGVERKLEGSDIVLSAVRYELQVQVRHVAVEDEHAIGADLRRLYKPVRVL